MRLSELTPEEQIVLVAILELTIASDARVSDEEQAQIQKVVAEIGADAYHRASAEADKRFSDEDQLRMYVPTIARPAARELILETALEAAFPGTIDAHESSVLQWLADTWGLKIRPLKSGHPS